MVTKKSHSGNASKLKIGGKSQGGLSQQRLIYVPLSHVGLASKTDTVENLGEKDGCYYGPK